MHNNTLWKHRPLIDSLAESSVGYLKCLNYLKKIVDIDSDISYHLLSSFEWKIYHDGVGVFCSIWLIRWRIEVRALIEFLAI